MEFITLIALLPFVLLFLLIVFMRWPVIKAMPLVLFITLIALLFLWNLSPLWATASFIKGTFIALEIMMIIFGAVWVLEILKEKKRIQWIQSFLVSISPDVRVQAIIIAWLFASIIEGVAGFGTPAAVAAPLLVSLGFSPFLSVIITLISNSTPVSFGAAGLPVNLGLGGLGFSQSILADVSKYVALFHLIGSFIIPLAIVYFVLTSFNFSKKEFLREFFLTIPFAIFSWLSFVIPYFLLAFFIGPELPSILGGIIGLLIVSFAAKNKFLTPRRILSFNKKQDTKKRPSKSKILSAVSPYILLIFLLAISRIIPLIKDSLSNISLSWINIFGLELSYSFLPFYTPSFSFLLVGIFSIILFKASKKEVSITIKNTWNKIKLPLIAIIFTLAFVQLLLVSGNNQSGLASMPLVLANSISTLFDKSYVFVSPFIGVFGAFIAGSNTVSNLLFAAFQAESAAALGLSLVVILALQVVGGAIGNMIAIHNVLAASASVGLKGQENKIIRKTIYVALIYGVIVAILGAITISLLS